MADEQQIYDEEGIAHTTAQNKIESGQNTYSIEVDHIVDINAGEHENDCDKLNKVTTKIKETETKNGETKTQTSTHTTTSDIFGGWSGSVETNENIVNKRSDGTIKSTTTISENSSYRVNTSIGDSGDSITNIDHLTYDRNGELSTIEFHSSSGGVFRGRRNDERIIYDKRNNSAKIVIKGSSNRDDKSASATVDCAKGDKFFYGSSTDNVDPSIPDYEVYNYNTRNGDITLQRLNNKTSGYIYDSQTGEHRELSKKQLKKEMRKAQYEYNKHIKELTNKESKNAEEYVAPTKFQQSDIDVKDTNPNSQTNESTAYQIMKQRQLASRR